MMIVCVHSFWGSSLAFFVFLRLFAGSEKKLEQKAVLNAHLKKEHTVLIMAAFYISDESR